MVSLVNRGAIHVSAFSRSDTKRGCSKAKLSGHRKGQDPKFLDCSAVLFVCLFVSLCFWPLQLMLFIFSYQCNFLCTIVFVKPEGVFVILPV